MQGLCLGYAVLDVFFDEYLNGTEDCFMRLVCENGSYKLPS